MILKNKLSVKLKPSPRPKPNTQTASFTEGCISHSGDALILFSVIHQYSQNKDE